MPAAKQCADSNKRMLGVVDQVRHEADGCCVSTEKPGAEGRRIDRWLSWIDDSDQAARAVTTLQPARSKIEVVAVFAPDVARDGNCRTAR